jgi:hypothetical protein
MTRVGWCLAAVALAAAFPAVAQKDQNKLPEAVAKALEKAGELEVYSLGGETTDPGAWRGSKVLGKTTAKKEDSAKLATALAKGVTEGDKGARCFVPRYGVRAAHGGKTYDLVISFECGWVYVYTDTSDKPQVFLISDSPRKVLDKLLTDAKVPLAKPEK